MIAFPGLEAGGIKLNKYREFFSNNANKKQAFVTTLQTLWFCSFVIGVS